MLNVFSYTTSTQQRARHEAKRQEKTQTPRGYIDSVVKCAGSYINDYYLYHLRLIFSQIHYTLNVGFLTPSHFKVYVFVLF